MEASHPLKTLLQLHLASDSSAVVHLPVVLDTLSQDCFRPSSHVQKWIARVNSLIHSKDTGARWSGLCLALRTSICSKSIMVESATSWVTAALLLLSKNEPVPVLKAAVRLLTYIFANTTGITEFQRQVSIPNVPKLSLALIALAGKQGDQELQLLAMNSLTHLIPLYPSLHRALQPQLSGLALKYLSGSAPRPTSPTLLKTASSLYSVLHLTGGKVGAIAHWRKSLEDTIAFSWEAFSRLRTTFTSTGPHSFASQPTPTNQDPLISIPLNMDRLRAGVHILCVLLSSTTPRAVSLPLGSLVRFCQALLRCAAEEDRDDGHFDRSARILESSVTPELWTLGCILAENLSRTPRQHLTPHMPQLAFCLAYRLEQNPVSTQRLAILRAINTLFTHCHYFYDSVLSSRLLRAILPSLTVVLAPRSLTHHETEQSATSVMGKKGKKRARGFEGDEIFKVAREIIFQTNDDQLVVLAALDAVETITRKTQATPAVHSIVSRVLLSILMSLPYMPPILLSQDLSFHRTLHGKLQDLCVRLGSGTTSTMSKSLGLIVHATQHGGDCARDTFMQHEIDLLLHPRVPPLVRSLPHVEALSLFPAEEGQEERDARQSLGLGVTQTLPPEAPSQLADISTPTPQADMVADPELSSTLSHPTVIPDTTRYGVASPSPDNLPMGIPARTEASIETQRTNANLTPLAPPSSVQPKTWTPSSHWPSANVAAGAAPTSTLPLSSAAAGKARADEAPSLPAAEQEVMSTQVTDDEPMPTINMESDSDSD